MVQNTESKLILCACGCGQKVKSPSKWVKSHNIKTLHEFGINSSHWKGGIKRTVNGYISQYQPSHKFADRHGCVYQHRLVWEKSHNAMLLSWADVHHINGVKDDNKPENLEGMMKAEHTYRHVKKDLSNRFCFQCNQKTYTDYRGYEVWHRNPTNKNLFLCRKCYRRTMWRLRRIS